MRRITISLLISGCLSLVFSLSAFGAAYTAGDVFAAVDSSGIVKEFTPTGTLVQTLNDNCSLNVGGCTFTTGMAFDSAGNLYVTNFNATVGQLNNSGTVLNSAFINKGTSDESIVATSTGFWVGDAGSNQIREFPLTGGTVPTTSLTATIESRGTDWIDFQNANTILYTSEGHKVMSISTTGVQNPDFATGLAGIAAYALRVIPVGSASGDAGDVLVADSSHAVLLSSTGALLKTYTLPGNGGGDFSLNLDPNGTDFWTGDFATGLIWEVNINTEAIDHSFSTGVGSTKLFGVAVFGEKTTTTAGEASTPLLLLIALGFGLICLKGSGVWLSHTS